MMRPWLAVAVMALCPRPAHALREEVELSLSPTLNLLGRSDRTNLGGGATVSAAYGLRDILAVEASFGCNTFRRIAEGPYEEQGLSGGVRYDLTRCSVVPGVLVRLGSRFVTSLSLGLGYRFSNESSRAFVADGLLVSRLDSATDHELVTALRASFDWRFVDTFAVGGFASWQGAISGGGPEPDFGFGIAGRLFFYP
jgi:hypothetical protein